MIRRFETYRFLPGTPDGARQRLAAVLLGTERYIPEVDLARVGWNHSDAPAELVWEHAYASAEAYRRYMVHPYHAELIDRYVLPDSPERVVETTSGAGLFGYHCDAPGFVLPGGAARRVVLLRLEGSSPAVADAFAELTAAESAAAGAIVSVLGANTMASCWFDGETPLPGPPPRWTHIWEQGFADVAALQAHMAAAGTDAWQDTGVSRWTELHYTPLEAIDDTGAPGRSVG